MEENHTKNQENQPQTNTEIDTETESETTYNNLINLIKKHEVSYKIIEHKPATTSEESSKFRNTPLKSGAKAMIIKVKDNKDYVMIVISAAYKIKNKSLRQLFDSKSIKFLSITELFNVTSCKNGAVPPFGSLFNIKTYADKSIISQGEYICFNGGMRSRSFIISTSDYLKIESPVICDLCDLCDDIKIN